MTKKKKKLNLLKSDYLGSVGNLANYIIQGVVKGREKKDLLHQKEKSTVTWIL